jgi:deoxyribose-phosphate aldolase
MVIPIGRLKAGDTACVRKEIAALREALPGKILKVIIETCLLTDGEKREMCDIVCAAGADYVKTSTGFSSGGATFADVDLLVRAAGGRCKVKASGGIKSIGDMERYLDLGAERLGTSSAVRLLG